jgi:quinol monooxygenase YgiN
LAIGRPFAVTIFMILVIIRMKVRSEKRMVSSQTIASLSGSVRMEKGCQPNSQIETKGEET